MYFKFKRDNAESIKKLKRMILRSARSSSYEHSPRTDRKREAKRGRERKGESERARERESERARESARARAIE